MRTRRVLVSLFAGALAVTVVGWGCNKQNQGGSAAVAATNEAPPPASVAIVNYDNVLRDMQWKTKFDNDIKACGEQLGKELQAAEARYQDQLNELQKAVGKEPEKLSSQQQQQLSQIVGAMRQTDYQLKQQANEKLNAYRAEWIKRYREALAPIARQVAQQKKFTVVLQQTENIIVYFDPTTDISDAVVDAARAAPPHLEEVSMPSLQAPPGISVNMATTAPTTGPSTAPTTKP